MSVEAGERGGVAGLGVGSELAQRVGRDLGSASATVVRWRREAREADLRSDDAAEKFVSAELEGGYWLKPLKDASDYWAMESARRL